VILVVEDSPEDEALILQALVAGSLGPVMVLRDGGSALEYLLGAAGPVPDVVLLDMNLPGMKGPEVLRQIRASPQVRHVPVVIFTSSARVGEVERSYELGANSFVVKPRDPSRFGEAIRAIARYWMELNRAAGSAGAT
jgi:CheY-like chemotaxis protein